MYTLFTNNLIYVTGTFYLSLSIFSASLPTFRLKLTKIRLCNIKAVIF